MASSTSLSRCTNSLNSSLFIPKTKTDYFFGIFSCRPIFAEGIAPLNQISGDFPSNLSKKQVTT
ncbi:MAG: hypothetical protein D3926_05025 [Desulfobacteraceae bacterium]|nr:MAG: hypothetical protein D3926_05025 [Desulfobacteraceae bacterium]